MTLTGPDTPIIIAHRGACGYLPEHTLAAKATAHAMGADFIEQDVVLSRDGVPLVMHDIYLDTTTDVADQYPGRARKDGRYYALDFDLQEIRQLKARERRQAGSNGDPTTVYPDRFPAHAALFGVPTLDEEIELIAGMDKSRGKTTGLYVEFKAPNWHLAHGKDVVAAVLEVLARKGYADKADQVFLQCFDDSTLRRLRHEIRTPLPLIQLIAENSWGEDGNVDYDYLRTAEGMADIATYADGIGPWLMQIYSGKDPSGKATFSKLTQLARNCGLLIHPYTLRRDELPDGVANFTELLDIILREAGVDGVFTDFPDLVREFLLERDSG